MAPKAIAHISGDHRLTYDELRRRSDALAAYLTDRFGADRAPIGVLGHREPEMLIAFLGTAKSGRPYVPIDTLLARPRVEKILAISRAAMLLSAEEVAQLSRRKIRGRRKFLERNAPFYILFTS